MLSIYILSLSIENSVRKDKVFNAILISISRSKRKSIQN